MICIGEEIRMRLRISRHSCVWMAQQLSCSRTNLYKIFKKQSIDTSELLRISRILDYDFFKLYSEEFSHGEDIE